jgi:hypothetical protein
VARVEDGKGRTTMKRYVCPRAFRDLCECGNDVFYYEEDAKPLCEECESTMVEVVLKEDDDEAS